MDRLSESAVLGPAQVGWIVVVEAPHCPVEEEVASLRQRCSEEVQAGMRQELTQALVRSFDL